MSYAERIDRLIRLQDQNTAAILDLVEFYKRRNRKRRTISRVERQRVITAHGSACIYCEKKLLPEECVLDHVVPLALDGGDVEENLAVACAPCNTIKGPLLAIDVFGVAPLYNGRRWVVARKVSHG